MSLTLGFIISHKFVVKLFINSNTKQMKTTNLFLEIAAIVLLTTGSLMATPNFEKDPEGVKADEKTEVKLSNLDENVENKFKIGEGHQDLEGEDDMGMPFVPGEPDELPTNIDNELELRSFSVYPNPSNGSFKLKVSSESTEPFFIEIYGVDGKVIYTEKINSLKDLNAIMIDLRHEQSGFYFVNILQGEKRIIKKIIIE